MAAVWIRSGSIEFPGAGMAGRNHRTGGPGSGSRRAPATTEAGQDRAEARRQRLAEALRDNLKKRKAQARGRTPGGADDSGR